jgi:hypothetical protein
MDLSAVAALLTYHVLNGTSYASDFTDAGGPLLVSTIPNKASYSDLHVLTSV